jgi:hypothetical protein
MPLHRPLASSFCDGSVIAQRIERLLDEPPAHRTTSFPFALRWASVLALLAMILVSWEPALKLCYGATEAAVRLLQ